MPILSVGLHEGFAGDTVTVTVNGREVFDKDGVQTMLLTGHALTFEVEVPAGPLRVVVKVPNRHLSEKFTIEGASGPRYVGIAIECGRLRHYLSEHPFGYA